MPDNAYSKMYVRDCCNSAPMVVVEKSRRCSFFGGCATVTFPGWQT